MLFHMMKKCIVLVLLNLETDMILFPGHNWPMLWKYKAKQNMPLIQCTAMTFLY